MYQIKDLKPTIKTGNTIECPVIGCTQTVSRQTTNHLKTTDEYFCPNHQIFISPSTFEYKDLMQNLLWKSSKDMNYLNSVLKNKRESRMKRERSEDALTWNVFRYLQNHNLLSSFLKTFTGKNVLGPNLIFWSYSSIDSGSWEPLDNARSAFGELPGKGSEPDLIIDTKDHLFFIEVKYTSSNKTKPSNIQKLIKYETEANNWYEKTFHEDINKVSVDKQKYELMRFWLLGTWIAEQQNKSFTLVSLTPLEMDQNLKKIFEASVLISDKRSFVHSSWEELNNFIRKQGTSEGTMVSEYLELKSAGYKTGKLQKVFQ
jgi:Holliday junction resolvase-like predicted endonuclease